MRRFVWLPMTLAVVSIVAIVLVVGAGPPLKPATVSTPSDTTLTSAAYLALLPDGEVKRRFILDCAGCHQFDARIAMPGGSPRPRESWIDETKEMLAFAGAQTGFPIISPSRDPVATADWLAEHLPPSPPMPAPRPEMPDYIAVTEYDLPRAMDLPHDVAVDPEGRVVVTGMFSHVMYVLDPETGHWSERTIPEPDANPRAVEIDPVGTWWVVLGTPEKLARFHPDSGQWKTFDLGVYPHEIARDAERRVWFNGHFTKEPELLGFVDPATGERRIFEVPSPGMPDGGSTIPYGLRVGPDGIVWMTELIGGRLVRFDPRTETFDMYDLPTPFSGPRRLDVGPDGVVWIPEFANNRLARFDPSTETFTEYAFPTRDVLPYVARVDRRSGAVWVATAGADLIARFDPETRTFTEIPLPTRGALVRHLDIDPRTGDVWGAYGAAPPTATKIFRIQSR